MNVGTLRVGIAPYKGGQGAIYPGFSPIMAISTSNDQYQALSPFYLRDEYGRIMENLWQFSKVFRGDSKGFVPTSASIFWKYPRHKQLENDQITKDYLEWREQGMNNNMAVRYPASKKYKNTVAFSLVKSDIVSLDNPPLNYIEARKQIYIPTYTRLLIKTPQFQELRNRWLSGENLLILDIDGPRSTSLNYYMSTYNLGINFIQNNSMEATYNNIDIMMNDPKHPFGHGYCIALALLNSININDNPRLLTINDTQYMASKSINDDVAQGISMMGNILGINTQINTSNDIQISNNTMIVLYDHYEIPITSIDMIVGIHAFLLNTGMNTKLKLKDKDGKLYDYVT